MTDPNDTPSMANAEDGPQLLPTVDPASDVGKLLNDSVARLRFADVDREVREMAQKVLEGKASPRDLMALPEFQPLLEAGQKQFKADVDAMSDEERQAVFGSGAEQTPRSSAAGSGER